VRLAARLGCALALVLGLMPALAHAHTRSMSFAIWSIDGRDGSVRLELSELDRTVIQATVAAAQPHSWQAHLPRQVQLYDAAGPCVPEPASLQSLSAPPGQLRVGWRVRCSRSDGPRRVRSELLFDAVPSHVQLATVRFASGRAAVDVVLTNAQRDATLEATAQPGPTAWRAAARYVGLGIEHIVTGWDHLVFLVALLLLARSLRQVAAAVTGFTLGHSVTLSLAVLGYARPDLRAVEALIGLSVALVAAENVWLSQRRRSPTLPVVTVAAVGLSAMAAALWRTELALAVAGVGLFAACSFGLLGKLSRPHALRWAVAALFGLVHGFGFAGALEGLAPTTEQLALSLASFNAGVELGQLGCVALLWPLLVLLRRRGLEGSVVQWGSATAAALGTYWFIGRAFS